ncbi:MAG: DUF4919 domain-containing protein [Bacteroidales bacterium]
MRDKIFLMLFMLFTGMSLIAQTEEEAPDYDKIARQINNRESELYYPRLMRRFAANDTTLSLEDYRTLYYGFTMQEDYDPYRVSPYTVKMKEFSVADTISLTACDSIIKYGLKAVDDFPFDIRSMNLLIYGYKCKKDEKQRWIWTEKLKNIIDAIISSGDGESEESAFHVIYPAHEYDIINRFGLTAKNSVLIPPALDYIEVSDNKFNIKGYFFNISRILDVYHQKFEEKQ